MEKKNQVPKYPPLRFPEFTDEWKEVKLGEVLSFEVGYPFSSDAFNEEGNGVRLIKNRDLKADDRVVFYGGEYDAQYIVQNGDILIGMDGDFSPCLWKKGKALLNQRVGRVNANQNTSRVFILYVLVDSLKKIEHKTSSTTVKHLSHKDVEKIKASLPSLAEQKKIAALLSLIDERIEVQNAIIKEQEALKASLLRRLIDRTLRFPEFTDEWKVVRLGEVGKMYNGLSGKKAADFGAGYPFITYKMVFDSGVIDMSKVSYVEIGPGEKQNKVREGDIFFTTSSETIDEVGMSSVLLKDADNLFLNSFCFGYRLNTPNLTTSQYLGYMLRGPQMRMRISSLGQGITRFNISKEKVADLQIAIPSLPEQRKIAALLSLIDERIIVEKEYATLLQKQKAYLLRQMFV